MQYRLGCVLCVHYRKGTLKNEFIDHSSNSIVSMNTEQVEFNLDNQESVMSCSCPVPAPLPLTRGWQDCTRIISLAVGVQLQKLHKIDLLRGRLGMDFVLLSLIIEADQLMMLLGNAARMLAQQVGYLDDRMNLFMSRALHYARARLARSGARYAHMLHISLQQVFRL